MQRSCRWSFVFGLLLVAQILAGQQRDSLLFLARQCRANYSYERACAFYSQAMEFSEGQEMQTIEEELAQTREVQTSTRSVPVLNVIARAHFSSRDFFLYYPMPDHSFRQADSTIVYFPGNENEIYISRNEEYNELFSLTCGDKTYFSSDKLGGYGGYDLFCSTWDEALGEWGNPQNLGFPYSSSGDDMLYYETPDGLFSIFASNRSCSKDSMYVYVIDRKAKIEYREVEDSLLLQQLSVLAPSDSTALANGSAIPEDPWADRYQEITRRERELKKLISASGSDESMPYRMELDRLYTEKRRIEEHLFSTNALDSEISDEVNREVAGVEGSFIFTRKSMGKPLKIFYIDD